MINVLLDEPTDLNELSKKLISIYPTVDAKSFNYLTSLIDLNVFSEKVLVPINSIVEEKEWLEKNFKIILTDLLQTYGLVLSDLDSISPNYLKEYFFKRDINDLILSCVMISLMKSTEAETKFPASASLNYKTRMFVRSFHKPSFDLYNQLTGRLDDQLP